MHKFVLMSSAIWLFYMIQNVVINCVSKRWIPKLHISMCYQYHGWNWEMTEQKSMLIWQMYMEPTVFHTAVLADGLRDFELEKTALKMVIIRSSSFGMNEQTVLLWRTILKKICVYIHYSWNMGKMWCCKLHSWKDCARWP